MLTPKENLLEVLNWGKPEYIPLFTTDIVPVGLIALAYVEQPLLVPGVDPFGIPWLVEGIGAIPDSRAGFMFDDITKWKDYVKFPDLDKINFFEIEKQEREAIPVPNYDNILTELFHCCGIFERLAAFMGFENALISLVTEPEACHEFFDAYTDYKIKVANKLIDAYKPDVYVYFDDVANAKSTFMSPKVYREMIKPYHKKFADEVIKRGVIFAMHCCGRAEEIIEDFIDEGAKLWHSAQSMNDLAGILKRVKGRLCIEGGWDSQGRPGFIDATEEEVRAEVRRCVHEYGKNGGFILLPALFNEKGNSIIVGDDRFPAVIDEWMKVREYKLNPSAQ